MQLGDTYYILEGYSSEQKSMVVYGSFKKGHWQVAIKKAKKLKQDKTIKNIKVLQMTVTNETLI